MCCNSRRLLLLHRALACNPTSLKVQPASGTAGDQPEHFEFRPFYRRYSVKLVSQSVSHSIPSANMLLPASTPLSSITPAPSPRPFPPPFPFPPPALLARRSRQEMRAVKVLAVFSPSFHLFFPLSWHVTSESILLWHCVALVQLCPCSFIHPLIPPLAIRAKPQPTNIRSGTFGETLA